MKIYKFLILILSVFVFLTVNAEASEKSTADIKYSYANTYYLCENGDLFVSGLGDYEYFGDIDFMDLYTVDTANAKIYRLATGVKRIFLAGYDTLFVIKNDNSLWVRGRNIYAEGPDNSKDFWELTKIDDDVADVYASYHDDFPHYWLYKKTDDSLWSVGEHSCLNLNSIDNTIQNVIPVYITDNVKKATNGNDIYVLKNDNCLYTSINGNLTKIADGIKNIETSEGYGYCFEYALTIDNMLYIINENLKSLDDENLISDNVDKFNVDTTAFEETILYLIKSNTLYEEKFRINHYDFKISDLKEEKIFDNVTDVYPDWSFCSFLTDKNELYTIEYAKEASDNSITKRNGEYIKLFNFNYALSSDKKGVAIFSSQNCGINHGYDSNDFNFNNNGMEYIDKTYSSWAEKEVKKAIDVDIVPSFLQMKYKNNITRSEFCRLAIKMLTTKFNTNIDRYIADKNIVINENRFKDTTDKSILLAENLGIVKGYDDNSFKPDSNITRQEAAVLLNNLSIYMNVIGKGENNNVFYDDNKIGNWAKESVYNINNISDKNGNFVMSGVGNNCFDPQGFYTREQTVLTVYRLYGV